MDKQNSDNNMKHDEELFHSLDINRKMRNRKLLFTVAGGVLLLALVGAIVVSSLKESVWSKFGAGAGQVLRCDVAVSTITKAVSGSGVLKDVDLETVCVPNGVEILEVLVTTNDTVTEGQAIATVDLVSVRSAINDLQQRLDAVDAQIRSAEDDSVSSTISAGVSGRVKQIYGEIGLPVEQVVFDYGALAVLSLDGYMAVDIGGGDLLSDQTVSVRWSGGSLTGTVEQVCGDVATILFSDLGPTPQETVTVCDLLGNVIGNGSAYIHSPFRITGYAGKVSRIHVKTDDIVKASTKLFTLEDTQCTANYDTLLRQRKELEEDFLELLSIQHHRAVVSPVSGSVFSCEDPELPRQIAVICPDKEVRIHISVDELDILSLCVGQKVMVTVASVAAEPFEGILTRIDRTMSDGGYSAEITLPKVEGMLSGMTADVSIEILCAENVVVIPLKALNQTQNGAYVYTGYDPDTGKYENRVDVVTGLIGGNYVEIKQGLKAGDTVYYTDATSVKDLFDSMYDKERPHDAASGEGK